MLIWVIFWLKHQVGNIHYKYQKAFLNFSERLFSKAVFYNAKINMHKNAFKFYIYA